MVLFHFCLHKSFFFFCTICTGSVQIPFALICANCTSQKGRAKAHREVHQNRMCWHVVCVHNEQLANEKAQKIGKTRGRRWKARCGVHAEPQRGCASLGGNERDARADRLTNASWLARVQNGSDLLVCIRLGSLRGVIEYSSLS